MRGRAGPWSCAAMAAGLLVLSGARLDAADARSLYQLGARAQASEDWPVAVEQYRAALAANPAYLEAAVGLAETLLALEQFEEATKWITRARLLDAENPDLAVLDGRIRLGAGEVTAARALFTGVLKAWPNNLEARFGLAEADVAEGRARSALDRYGAALAIAPQSRRGLLSLAILSESQGDTAAADRAMTDALRSHAGDVSVQLAASDLYAGRGRWDLAERHARAALAIAPESAAARRALATAHIALKRFDEAAGVLREVVAVNRGDAQAWYALGLAYARSGDHVKALAAFGSAIVAAPDDETARIVQEYTAIDALKAEDPQRAKLGAFHRDAGRQLESRSMLDKAIAEYRRSLLLEPASRDGRVGYARVNRAMGFPDKQLSELKVLVGLGVRDTAVLDEVEGLEAELDGSVSRLWGVDQYAIERLRHLIAVSTITGASPLQHPLADRGQHNRRGIRLRIPIGRAVGRGLLPHRTKRRIGAYLLGIGNPVPVPDRGAGGLVQRVPDWQRPGARRVPAHRAARRGCAARPWYPHRPQLRPRPRRPRFSLRHEGGHAAGDREEGTGAPRR
jgi:tetratricopeptide (TPR) repeat protein